VSRISRAQADVGFPAFRAAESSVFRSVSVSRIRSGVVDFGTSDRGFRPMKNSPDFYSYAIATADSIAIIQEESTGKREPKSIPQTARREPGRRNENGSDPNNPSDRTIDPQTAACRYPAVGSRKQRRHVGQVSAVHGRRAVRWRLRLDAESGRGSRGSLDPVQGLRRNAAVAVLINQAPCPRAVSPWMRPGVFYCAGAVSVLG